MNAAPALSPLALSRGGPPSRPFGPGWPGGGDTHTFGPELASSGPACPRPQEQGPCLPALLLRAPLAPPVGYLCGGPRRTGAAPRRPRSPKATGVPSRLAFRAVQPPRAPALRPGDRHSLARPTSPRAGRAAPPPAVGRRPGVRTQIRPGGEASPAGPPCAPQTSARRPGRSHLRLPRLWTGGIHGQVLRESPPFPPFLTLSLFLIF